MAWTLHPHEAIWFFFVEPEPPTAEWEEHDAQIILVQNPRHFERATLYTMIFHARAQVAIQRIARFSRSPVTFLTVLITLKYLIKSDIDSFMAIMVGDPSMITRNLPHNWLTVLPL